MFKPQPVAPDKADAPPAATPAPVAKATPPPLPDVIQPSDSEIAVAEKTPAAITRLVPAQVQPRPMPLAEPTPPPKAEHAGVANSSPQPPRPMPASPDAGFQAQTEKTKIEGSDLESRKGRGSYAIKTPLAVYKKQVNAAIGSRWYILREAAARSHFARLGETQLRQHHAGQDRRCQNRREFPECRLRHDLRAKHPRGEIGPPPDEAQSP
jgi:hypothetical protein